MTVVLSPSVADPSAAAQTASAPHPGPAGWARFLVKPARWLAWAVTGAGALLLLTQPVSADVQLALAAAVILVMACLWVGASGQLARMTFLTLGSLVILRYVFWRATSTLPSWNEP